MKLKELIEILDERVELVVYDKDYFYYQYEEFLKKNVIQIKPQNECKFVLKVYLEDFYDEEEEI